MPKAPAQIEHAIRQNSNDIAAIYEMLTGIDIRLIDVLTHLEGIEATLMGHGEKLGGI